jgi:hypothetical protein
MLFRDAKPVINRQRVKLTRDISFTYVDAFLLSKLVVKSNWFHFGFSLVNFYARPNARIKVVRISCKNNYLQTVPKWVNSSPSRLRSTKNKSRREAQT